MGDVREAVRGKKGEVRGKRREEGRGKRQEAVRGERQDARWEFSHERGTTGDSPFKSTKDTSGVQLATAGSKVSDMYRGDSPCSPKDTRCSCQLSAVSCQSPPIRQNTRPGDFCIVGACYFFETKKLLDYLYKIELLLSYLQLSLLRTGTRLGNGV